MRSFTDLFIRHPVLAVVVNLAIVLVGWRAISALPIQQYPQLESSSVVITTVYTGASARPCGGFRTRPIERAVSAIGGVDHFESTSRGEPQHRHGAPELKTQHDGGARGSELRACRRCAPSCPEEAGAALVEVQRADPALRDLLFEGFTSSERSVSALTDWLARTRGSRAARHARRRGRRVTIKEGGRTDRDARLDRPRPAWPRSISRPADVYRALQRNNYLAAVGQTKGNLVQVNLLADTDLRSVEEFEDLIVVRPRRRDRAPLDVARVELGAEEADLVAKYNRQESVYLGVWPLVGANEIEVAHAPARRDGAHRADAAADVEMRLVWDGTMFMRDALKEITRR
jgi:multidrug efflux pump